MTDREKVIKTIQNRINESRNKHLKVATIFISTLSDILTLLKEQECKSCGTVFDFGYKAGKESIVRCKDCKWFEMPRFGERGYCKNLDIIRETTFYCADGERKET